MAKKSAAKAYSYLRFSTPEQANGDSFRRQSEMATRYAELHGLELDTELTFRDLGISAYRGRNADTGALRTFLEAIEEQVVAPGSVLLVESLDRISRRTARKAVRVLEEIVEAGVDVVTLQDGKRYSVESLDGLDFIMAVLILIRGHEESATKGRRVHEANQDKRARLKDGRGQTKRVPAWMRVERDGVYPDGKPRWSKPRLIPERAAIVRRIFDSYLAGEGKEAITKKLNADKVPTFGSSDYWHRSYVQKILTNPAVVGVYVPHEFRDGKRVALDPIPDYFPKAIKPETWKRAQALMKSSGKTKARKGAVQNLLAGLAKCPGCGGSMTRVMKGNGSKAGRPKLVCSASKSGARDLDGSQFCQYRTVPLDDVEAAIIRAADDFERNVPARDPGLQNDIEGLESELEVTVTGLENLIAILAERPSDAIENSVRAMEAKADKLRAELEELRAKAEQSGSRLVANRAARLSKLLTGGAVDKAAANAALRECFRAVVVNYGDGDLRMKWRHTDQDLTVIYDAGFAPVQD